MRKATHRNITEQYDNYSKTVIGGLVVDKKTFKKILSRFSILVVDKVLEAEEVKIPILGTLRIQKKKQDLTKNKLKIDWAETKRTGKLMYHTNDNRNGYYYRTSWRKTNVAYSNYYSFVPERWYFKRRLKKLLKETKADFFEN